MNETFLFVVPMELSPEVYYEIDKVSDNLEKAQDDDVVRIEISMKAKDVLRRYKNDRAKTNLMHEFTDNAYQVSGYTVLIAGLDCKKDTDVLSKSLMNIEAKSSRKSSLFKVI